MSLSDLARRLLQPSAAPPAKPRARKRTSGLEAYQRTYGEKDGLTVFEAAQIKAKRKKKR